VTIWDVNGLEPRFTIDEAHGGRITTLGFSPDGRTLATGSDDRDVRLWSVGNGAELARLRGHSLEVGRVGFSADGSTLATCGFADDGRNQVVIWRAEPGERADAGTSSREPAG
jgi:WD40 repeat protein